MTARQMNEEDAKFQARFDGEWLDEHGELTLENYLILSEQYNAKIKEHHEDGIYLLCKKNTTGEVFEFNARVFSLELRQILFPKRAYIEPLIIDNTNDVPLTDAQRKEVSKWYKDTIHAQHYISETK